MCWNLYTKSVPHGKYLYIFPSNGVSRKWITPLSIKTKKRQWEATTFKAAQLLHQFVFCRYYYYYCQMAIRRSNLYSISWCYTVPEDETMDWVDLVTCADGQKRAGKIACQACSPHEWGTGSMEKAFYQDLLRGSRPLAFVLHVPGRWEHVDSRESQEEAPRGEMGIKIKSHWR